MLRGPCCPAYPFLWSYRLCARVRYHLGQAQWSSLLPILCCWPCPSVWTDSLSTLPAVSSQCPVNKLQLSVHLHLGPISCRSLTEKSADVCLLAMATNATFMHLIIRYSSRFYFKVVVNAVVILTVSLIHSVQRHY